MKRDESGLNKSEVHSLAALTNYSPGSIVSRVITKNDSGNITHFSFSEGQGLSKHSAPFDAFIYVIEGTADILIDETTYTLTSGETIIMPADIPHAVEAKSDFKMLLVMIKGK